MDREIYQYYVGRVPNISIILCCLMMQHKKIREVYDYAWSDECI